MKKILAIFAVLVMVLTIGFGFAACGSTGKYKFYGIKIGDKEYKLKDLTDDQKKDYITEDEYGSYGSYIQLKGNDTFVVYTRVENKKDDTYKTEIYVHGSYEVYGQKLIMDFSPKSELNSVEYIIRDGKIFIKILGTQDSYYIYKK